MAQTRLIQGTNRSDRPARVDALVREHWGRAILLVPSQAQAMRRVESLLLGGDLPGVWGRPVRALTDFTEVLLVAEGKPIRRLDDVERRLMLDRVLASLHASGAVPGMPDPDATPGLGRHLLQVIGQLKQAAIEPEAFRNRLARLRPAAPFDELVARVYEDYHEALVASDAYDIPGLYWQAHLTCLEGRPRALEGIELIALDGFDDFTPSELRLVEGFARHVETLVFGIHHDTAPDRKDLFALPERTSVSLLDHFDAAEEVVPEPTPRCQRSWLASRVFWRDQRPYPDGLRANLAVLPCIDTAHEMACVGRRVKTLIREGVPPEEIAIVHRGPAGLAATMARVFEEYGIGLSSRQKPPLHRSGVGAFLRQYFEAMEKWSREEVLEMVLSPWAHPGGTPDDAAPAFARAAGIVRGAASWRTRLARLGEALATQRGAEAEGLLARVPDAARRLEGLRERLAWLAAIHESLPGEATQAGFAVTLDGILEALRVDETAVDAAEQAALSALRRMLGVLADCSDGNSISRTVFLRRFETALRDTPYTLPRVARGVTLTDPHSVRGLAFCHVFLMGMNEGVLPAPAPANAVYGERDLERLRRAGIDLEGSWAHHARERLLFHHALESATESLTLSWCAMKENGREAMPSPFLADVREIFAGHADIEAPIPRSEDAVPSPEDAASEREYGAALAHMGARPADLGKLKPFEGAARALATELRRQGGDPFDPWDGALADPGLVRGLAAHFGEQHHFSANQIETCVSCPFRFFLERVLHLAEAEAPAEELDPRTRGSLLHAILQRFHQRFQGVPIPDIPVEQAREALEAILPTVFADNRWRTHTCPDGLLAMEQRVMRARLDRYLRIARGSEDESAWAPTHFEAAFGRTPREDADPLSREAPYGLATPLGEVLFAGVVDRIDAGPGDALRIVDYKSSTVPAAGDVTAARDIQLSLYTEVVERALLAGRICTSAVYMVPGRNTRREVIPKKDDKWHAQREALTATVADAVTRIRTGSFPPTPTDDGKVCAACGQRRVCRYDQHRIARKLAGEGKTP